MIIRHSIYQAVSLAVLGIACSVSDVAEPDSGLVRFSVTNGPAHPGPIVYRFKAELFVVNIDLDHSLASFHFDVDQPPTFPGFFEGCGTDNTGDVLDIQVVLPSSEQFHQLLRRRDSHVAVYDLTGQSDIYAAVGTCAFLLDGSRRLAQGEAHLSFSDNDATSAGPGGNTWRMSSQGQLTGPDGDRVGYTETMVFQLRPDGTFVSPVEKISLSPDPRQ